MIPNKIKIYFDGGVQPNIGISYGVVVKDSEDNIITQFGKKIVSPKLSSNQAEYLGLITALTYCLANNHRNVDIFGDSQLVIRQCKGEYKVREEKLIPLHAAATMMLEGLERYTLTWIDRDRNSEADRQTR